MRTALAAALLVLAACSDSGGGVDGAVDAGPPATDMGQPPVPDLGPPPMIDLGPPPEIDRVRPNSGSVEGGTFVTVRGVNFSEETQPIEVLFGETPAPEVALLDAFALEVVSPPNAEGVADVTVITETGSTSLANAFTYEPVFEVTRIEPARVPEEGGVEVRLFGRGFTPETLALIDRTPLVAAEVVSDTEIAGIAPSSQPGRPPVTVLNRVSRVEERELLVVYATPEVDAVAPQVGATGGGDRVALVGSGFIDVQEVRFGGAPAEILEVFDDRMEVRTPAMTSGPVDIELVTADEVRVFSGLFAAFGVGGPAALFGAAPSFVVADSATTVSIVGAGLGIGVSATIGGVAAPLIRANDSVVEVELPSGVAPGPVDVVVTTGAGDLTLTDALTVVPALRILAVEDAPDPADPEIPFEVTVVGEGLTYVTELRLGDIVLTDVNVLTDSVLTANVPTGRHGPADLVAFGRAAQRAEFASAVTFLEPFELLQLDPPDGAFAGGTLVTVYGRGFRPPATVSFNGVEGTGLEFENGSVLAVRTPQATSGSVDVEVDVAGEPVTLPLGFTYFDPRSIVGGGFGGPIRGDVNMSVLDGQGQPLAGATVQVGYDGNAELRATTNADGIAVISTRDLRGPLTITAGRPGSEFVTFYDLDVRNLTAISSPNIPPPDPDAPVFPCPDPVMPPIIRGNVFGLKSELDPNSDPNIVPVVTVTYSARDPFTANPDMIPGAPMTAPPQIVQVFGEGEEFEIATARAGTVAVFALLEEVDTRNPANRTPVRLGIARSVPVAPNQVTEGVVIDMVIDLDQTFEVRLDDPPDQFPGPTLNAIFPFLNLESDGVIGFPPQAAPNDLIILENMPDLARSQFIYLAGSLTPQPGGGLGPPWSLNIQQSAEAQDGGEDLGPFLQQPSNIVPKSGDVVLERTVSYERDGVVPDLSISRFLDSELVVGRCCIDINENGMCDDGEPVQGGGLPQSYARWSLYGPGAPLSVELPIMPPGVDAFDAPQQLTFNIQQALAPRFTFAEFSFNQFSPFFWQSWTSVSTAVVIKEETD